MFKNILSAATMAAVLFGCQDGDSMKTTESGLQYQFINDATEGVAPDDGEILIN